MSNYKHGVYVSETSTSLIPTVEVSSAIPFVVGTAPVNKAMNPSVNKVQLINSYADAVDAFGFEDAKINDNGYGKFAYTLSEFMKAHFSTYATVPVVMLNVLDPAKHRKTLTATELKFVNGTATLQETGVITDTVSLSKTNHEYQNTDYVLAFDDNGYLVVNALKNTDGTYKLDGVVNVAGFKLAPEAVTADDIIGGVDAETGLNKGLECIADVYPKFGIVPTLLLAPGFSSNAEVAIVMAAKAKKINDHFEAVALIDAPANASVKSYSDVPSWKTANGISSVNSIVLWPNVLLGKNIYHASTHLAGVIGITDEDSGSVPYRSPSNKNASISGLCLDDGSEVVFGVEKANYLNGQGIVTFSNFNGGWKVWGNRTAAYPGNTDPKDAFIPVKRMFHYVANTIVLSMWQKVDEPGNRRLIDSVVDSMNVWLNSLAARGQILGGRIEFRQIDNSTVDLMDGKYNFKVYITPPSPAEELNFDLEIDINYYDNLFV